MTTDSINGGTLFRRVKPMNEMLQDPDFSLRIGRLIGASEMAGYVLTRVENPDYKHVGEQLAFVAEWFFVKE